MLYNLDNSSNWNIKVDKRKTISHASVGVTIGSIPGFRRGFENQAKIIAHGSLFRTIREKETKLNESEAAELIGISQSELNKIESGSDMQGPSFLTITKLVEAYKEFLFEQDGTILNFTIKISRPNYHQTYFLTPE